MKRIRTDVLPVGEDDPLPAQAAHHVLHVMRMRPGATLLLFDGRGKEQEAELLPEGRVRGTSDLRTVEETGTVTLVIAILKHQAMDDAIRMATEAGAAQIWPVFTQRCVPKRDRADRWERIVRSAAEQCGRSNEPTVHGATTLRECLASLDVPLFVGVPGAAPATPHEGACAVVIGPEGGLTPAELTLLSDAGAIEVNLGLHILRASTAAPVAVSLLQSFSPSPTSM